MSLIMRCWCVKYCKMKGFDVPRTYMLYFVLFLKGFRMKGIAIKQPLVYCMDAFSADIVGFDTNTNYRGKVALYAKNIDVQCYSLLKRNGHRLPDLAAFTSGAIVATAVLCDVTVGDVASIWYDSSKPYHYHFKDFTAVDPIVTKTRTEVYTLDEALLEVLHDV